MKCWICGAALTESSGEHRLKHSDLKSSSLNPTNKNPIFFTSFDKFNVPIKSLKRSKLLKFDDQLCPACNTSESQPYDLAWQKVSEAIRDASPKISEGSVVDLGTIFQKDIQKSLLDVHLYFVKAFGCRLVYSHQINEPIPISIDGFAAALRSRKPHPNMFIKWCVPGIYRGSPFIGDTPMHVEGNGVIHDLASWASNIEHVSIQVMFALPSIAAHPAVRSSWHPSSGKAQIVIQPTPSIVTEFIEQLSGA